MSHLLLQAQHAREPMQEAFTDEAKLQSSKSLSSPMLTACRRSR